jgi:hypothetical protein
MSSPWPWWPDLTLDGALPEPVEALCRRIALAIANQRLPHALMLVGVTGGGRERAALEAAALLTCSSGGSLGCTCSSCSRARHGNHPDIEFLGPEGAAELIKIAPIRQLVGAVSGLPYEAPRRVWILAGVEARHFGGEAANALLKTLEEPPAHAVFLLLASNPEGVLPTIRSRCQSLRLPAPQHQGEGLALGLLDRDHPEIASWVSSVRASLRRCLNGRRLDLLRMAQVLGGETGCFELLCAAATEEAMHSEGENARCLLELASRSLEIADRARALNLDASRQLTGLLFRWARHVDQPTRSLQ